MFIPLSAKQAVSHGFYFVKGKIVYIWCSDMVGKVTLTKMELIMKLNLIKREKIHKYEFRPFSLANSRDNEIFSNSTCIIFPFIFLATLALPISSNK